VDNFLVDRIGIYGLPSGRMVNAGTRAREIRALSGVAGHLASALDVLLLSGCDWFAADILEMLAIIDGQIAVLEEFGNEDSA
jgi:hypothetical protein